MAFGSTNLAGRGTNLFDGNDPLGQLLGESLQPMTPEQTRQARINQAKAEGYRYDGGSSAWRAGPGGIPTSRPLGNFGTGGAGSGVLGSFGNLPPILLEALRSDTQRMQGAADEQHARIGDWESKFNEWLGGSSDELQKLGSSNAQELKDAAGRAESLGDRQAGDLTRRADDMRTRVRGDVDKALSRMPDYYKGIDKASGDIDEAYRLGDAAVADYKSALKGYKDMSAQDMSAAASGIRRNFYSAMQQVRSGTGPDGRPMSATEQMAATEQIRFQANQQVQEQITPLQSRFNDTMMQLHGQLAGLMQGNAGMRLQGAALRGNLAGQRLQGIGTELGGAQIKAGAEQTSLDMVARAHEGQRQMYQIGATLREAGATIATSVQLQALQLEMNGQVQLAQVMMQNPRSIVSYFQSFLALMSVSATQGGGGFGSGNPTNTPSNPTNTPGRPNPGQPQNPAGRTPMGQQGGVGAGYGYNSLARQKRDAQNMGPPEYQMTGTEEDFFA